MNIGLVLSGGAAQGAYQVGALRALSEFVPNNEIKFMSCASIGVLNGYAYISSNLDRAEALWHSLCATDKKMFIGQVCRSGVLQRVIQELYEEHKQISPAFYASLLDLNCRNIVYQDLSKVGEDNIPLYLKACVSMPVYNHSVQIQDHAYLDGAFGDNIPVFPLLQHELDYVICIYTGEVSYKFENTEFDSKVIKIAFPCEKMLKDLFVFNQENIESAMVIGYERAKEIFGRIFAQGYDHLETIYREIARVNDDKTSNFRITGDVLITNLNKIAKKIAKNKIQ